jgi:hypothetical protein
MNIPEPDPTTITSYVFILSPPYVYILRPLKKRCRILPAGGAPQLQKPPKIGGYRFFYSSSSIKNMSDGIVHYLYDVWQHLQPLLIKPVLPS